MEEGQARSSDLLRCRMRVVGLGAAASGVFGWIEHGRPWTFASSNSVPRTEAVNHSCVHHLVMCSDAVDQRQHCKPRA